MTPVIACRNLEHEFPSAAGPQKVIKGISLEIHPGELTMLVGPSGCGKTTLISIVAGLLRHTRGEVVVFGHDLSRLTAGELLPLRLRQIGFVFQQFNLLSGLTSAENTAVPLVANNWNWSDAQARALEMLARLGMAEHAQKLPRQLSGGQQQRVAIARSLVHEPQLLLCDEPTAALDSRSGQTVITLLKELAVHPDRAAVVVTHDPRIYSFADRMIHLEDGLVTKVEIGSGTGESR